MEWLTLFSQPITQLGGVIALAAALQKAGIDVRGALQAALGIGGPGNVKAIDVDNRNALQPILSQMDALFAEQKSLREYYNHDTTDLLTQIRDAIKAVDNGVLDTNRKLGEFEKYGIPCRDKK